MAVSAEQAEQVWREADCLHDQASVEKALDRMAREITASLGARDPLISVS